MANPQNLTGHRARYDFLRKKLPPDKVGFAYVGGGDKIDPALVGFIEEELIRRHHALDDAHVVDLGCGVGRLTRYLVDSPVRSYLGIDIIPEILADAEKVGVARPTFRFALTDSCSIPEQDGKADIICGFSLITHLLDEETFVYFQESARVLKRGGTAVFSFLDFSHPRHQSQFTKYAASYKSQRDLLKFFEKSTLGTFAKLVDLEVIDMLDAGQSFLTSGARATMLNGDVAPRSTSNGQSTLYMRKP